MGPRTFLQKKLFSTELEHFINILSFNWVHIKELSQSGNIFKIQYDLVCKKLWKTKNKYSITYCREIIGEHLCRKSMTNEENREENKRRDVIC